MGIRLETERLIVRPIESRDGDAWFAMITDPDVRRYLPPGPLPTRDAFAGALEKRHAMERQRGYTLWAVEAKATGDFVGQSGLVPVEGIGPEIEIAYHFAKASWGKGYATEAAIAVLAHGLDTVCLERIIAIVMPGNIGSCRVVEKAGMRFEGTATYYGIPGLRKYAAMRGRR
jgi:RimJ/RimL family protein N-acetyltransferase